MCIHVHPVQGDIVEFAPGIAQLSALWVCGGFKVRYDTWRRVHEQYFRRMPMEGGVDLREPWRAATDQVFEIDPPDGLLRFVYVFSNPSNASSVPALGAVQDAIVRLLDRAVQLGTQRVAMIHIPSAPEGRQPNDQQDIGSAAVMIAAIQRWDVAHPAQDYPAKPTDVYLVDLGGDFGSLLCSKPWPEYDVPVPE
jgi:hypothetical protein